jgi:hypothetical protein
MDLGGLEFGLSDEDVHHGREHRGEPERRRHEPLRERAPPRSTDQTCSRGRR